MNIITHGNPPPAELRGTCPCGAIVECWKREARSEYDLETGDRYSVHCPTCLRAMGLEVIK